MKVNQQFSFLYDRITMNKYIILFWTLFSMGNLIGQYSPVYTHLNFVIANGGLNLRSEPNVNSKKIANIPFGSTVNYISDKAFKTDSILIRHSNDQNEYLQGSWVNVEYKNMKGYVLDIFLTWQPEIKERFVEKYNNDFVLLFPGCDCNSKNFYDPNGWQWFGYFKQGEDKYKVEEIKISYYRDDDCNLTLASKSENLSFIIGSKKRNLLNQEIVQGNHLYLLSDEPDSPLMKSQTKNLSIELIKNQDKNEWKPNELYLVNGNKRQLLNKPEYDYAYKIKFVGDLDGDSKNDFIIHYGDKVSVFVLYLTSQAKEGNLIENVAMYFTWYCC